MKNILKLKVFIVNSLLFLGSVLIPLSIFNIYFGFQYINITRKLNFRKTIIDTNYKKLAINDGYLPIFFTSNTKKIANKYGIFPIGSLPYTKTYYCNEGYGLVRYESDRFGLRNNDDKWKNVMNQNNIFIIGDSFVDGSCVLDNQTIASNIQEKMNINTINLGLASNGPYEYMAVLKTISDPILKEHKKENKVILFFYFNDIDISRNKESEDLLDQSSSILFIKNGGDIYPKKYYKDGIEKLIKENFPTSSDQIIKEIEKKGVNLTKNFLRNNIIKTIKFIPLKAKLLSFYRKVFKKYYSLPDYFLTKRTISLLSKVCSGNCKPTIVYIPHSNYWKSHISPSYYKNLLEKLANEMDIFFVNGEEIINRKDRKNYAPEGGHLSIEGYKKLSNFVSNKIKSRDLTN